MSSQIVERESKTFVVIMLDRVDIRMLREFNELKIFPYNVALKDGSTLEIVIRREVA